MVMKRCPECRRDYYDDTLLYCLDDGNALLEGPADGNRLGESPTLRRIPTADQVKIQMGGKAEDSPKNQKASAFRTISPVMLGLITVGLVIASGTAYWFFLRGSAPSEKPVSGLNSAVNDDYLRAKVLVASENKPDNEAAIKLLKNVVAVDPRFAPGWAALGRAYSIKAFYFATDSERKQLTEDAEVAVERSFSIDPNLGDAYFARGFILWTHSNRFPHEQAIQAFQRAIAINPKLDEAHHQLGLVYLHLGLFDKAKAELTNTLVINQSNTLARFRIGVIAMYAGKYEDALSVFKSTPLEKNPSLHAFQTATVLFQLGKSDEALSMIDKYLQDYPNDEGGVGTSVKAMIFAKAGKAGEAEDAIRRADELGRNFGHFHHAAYNIASAYALLNKPDQAMEWLQLAADDGFPCYPLFDSDQNLRNIRQNPKFIAFIAKSKQQWERYNATF